MYVSINFLIFFVICVRFQQFSKYYFFGFFEKCLKKLSEKYEYVSNFFFKNSVQKWNMCTYPTVRNFRTSGRSLPSALMSRFRAWVRLQLQKCPLFCTEFIKWHFFHFFYIFIVFFYNKKYNFDYFIGKIEFIPQKGTKCTQG